MSKSKPCNCPKCGELFESKSAMRRHKKSIHGLDKIKAKPYSWECPICHQFFKTLHIRDQHRIDEHGKYAKPGTISADARTWECKYCHNFSKLGGFYFRIIRYVKLKRNCRLIDLAELLIMMRIEKVQKRIWLVLR